MNYLKECLRTEPDAKEYQEVLNKLTIEDIRLIHGCLGLATEVGEIVDIVKKHLFYGKSADLPHLREETGDLAWYLALICNKCGFSFEEICQENIDKLRKRYPEKFSKEKALKRLDKQD